MKTMKKRIFSGCVCEQIVYTVRENTDIKSYDPEKPRKERFANEQERIKHREGISRRHHARAINANFHPGDLYSTLTFDDDWEVHSFRDAKRIRNNYIRRLLRAYPEAVIFLYMGRGKGTQRIHFHMVSHGIPKEAITEKWQCGSIWRVCRLREHNYYDGVDYGADYTGLANYLWNHWTPEVGGHHYYKSKNAKAADEEKAKEVAASVCYSQERPPRAPKGMRLVEVQTTPYGYQRFKYVADTGMPDRKQAG